MPCYTATASLLRLAVRATTPLERPLSHGSAPNQLRCADFNGEFKLGNGRYCS
jgi:hypothetical protein